ncbi:hypothetical protein OUZ56_026502 [Daphnia magna]|uniref:Uncharacterized protein n=1 Tax=Daphnia magna TaxID=35525 RepID=A0ABQ9ZLX9_9CRUS|nr:hypothetical protein OUZ56_026502 [Daphnia magna]
MDSECPYSIPKSMWKHGLDCCLIVPKISPPDIFIYLVETKSYQNHLEALGAYKGISSESQQAVRDGWVREFLAIALPKQHTDNTANHTSAQVVFNLKCHA